MRTQKVHIQAYYKNKPDGKSIEFEGNLEELKTKMKKLQNLDKYSKPVRFLENKDKHKKLGMGLTIVAYNDINYIEHHTFWPISHPKPKLI